MKKTLLFVLALLLSASLLSCGSKETKPDTDAPNESEPNTENEAEASDAFSEQSDAEPTETEVEAEQTEAEPEEKYPLKEKAYTVSNLTYNEETKSKLDVYLPSASDCENGKAPLVLYIHGGTWVECSKSDILSAVKKYFTSNGYVFASINYRYASATNNCADMLAEIDSALNYLHDNADELHIDTSKKIGITGHSAGAHLSLMYGYTYKECVFDVGAIGAFAPCASFEYADQNELDRYLKANPNILTICSWLLGSDFDFDGTDVSVLDPIAPISLLNADVPATVMVYAEKDTTVLPSTSTAFVDKLPDSGAEYSVFALPNSGHNLDNPKDSDMLYEAIAKFAEMING